MNLRHVKLCLDCDEVFEPNWPQQNCPKCASTAWVNMSGMVACVEPMDPEPKVSVWDRLSAGYQRLFHGPRLVRVGTREYRVQPTWRKV